MAVDPRRQVMTTIEKVAKLPMWAIEAHLRVTRLIPGPQAREIARKVLDEHFDDEPSVTSLMGLYREAERRCDDISGVRSDPDLMINAEGDRRILTRAQDLAGERNAEDTGDR